MGKYMRGAWAAFSKDPEMGLKSYGWPRYKPQDGGKRTLVRLAWENGVGVNAAEPEMYDGRCNTTFPIAKS